MLQLPHAQIVQREAEGANLHSAPLVDQQICLTCKYLAFHQI